MGSVLQLKPALTDQMDGEVMSIKIYNSMTKKKHEFKPIKEGHVSMYVCGPTVYDFLHVGNFRGAIFFNVVRNWFEKNNYEVKYIYNYTDVDDKIINRANEVGTTPKELAEKYIAEFEKDYATLRLRPHTKNPRVTEHMADIINMVSSLIEKGKAYAPGNGDVYFDVQEFPDYGQLSNKNIDELESGVRIEANELKKHPSDFALWKSAKEGEPSWTSPWGEGRPGWHIECSVMAKEMLGETIDIHGGGLDLVFPHHENEIAQSEACSGKSYVNYWMHNNMLEFGQQKMSKSLGNVKTGRSFLEEYNGEVLKFLNLSSHYRSIIDFSDKQIERAISSLAKFYSSLKWAQDLIGHDLSLAPVPDSFQQQVDEASHGFEASMNEDFNTADALSKFFELMRAFNNLTRKPGKVKPEQKAVAEVYLHWIKDRGNILALFQENPAEYLQILDDMLLRQKGLNREDINQLVASRKKARENKDYAKSDEIRDQLASMGVLVMDSAEGSVWEVDKS